MAISFRTSRVARLAGALTVAASIGAVTLAAGSAQASTAPGFTPVWSAGHHTAAVLTLAPMSTAATYQSQVLAATNAQRKAHGLKSLTASSCLTGFASPWAAHLAATQSLTHQSLGPFLTKCNQFYAAENIADGNVTASDVVAMWMASPEHKANLLGSHYTHVAIGAAKSGSTWYVVQDFSG